MTMDPTGITMMIGMAVSAGFNAVMASTVEYDEKCKHVKELKESVDTVSDWCNQIETQFINLNFNIQDELDQLKKHTDVVKKAIANEKVRQTKLLHKEEIMGTVFCSMVTLLLLIKLLFRQI